LIISPFSFRVDSISIWYYFLILPPDFICKSFTWLISCSFYSLNYYSVFSNCILSFAFILFFNAYRAWFPPSFSVGSNWGLLFVSYSFYISLFYLSSALIFLDFFLFEFYIAVGWASSFNFDYCYIWLVLFRVDEGSLISLLLKSPLLIKFCKRNFCLQHTHSIELSLAKLS